MPKPKKTTGSGTKAFFSPDGKEYTLFASITKIGPPSMSRGTVEVTDMNSYEDNNQFKEYLGDFIEADEMSLEGYFVKDDTARDALETAFYQGDECYVKIQLPPIIGKSMIVNGIITKYRPIGDISTDAGIGFNASIKPNSKPQLVDSAETAAQTAEGGTQ